VGALPAALGEEGVEVRTLVPGYPAVLQALESAQQLTSFRGLRGGTARLLAATAHGLKLFVLDAPHYFKRPGNPYLGPDGKEWPDNAMRFAALAKIAAEIGLGSLPSYKPDIVHMHDWQAALAAAYIYYSDAAQKPGTVLTVHNLAFQGQFPAKLLKPLGLPEPSFAWDGVEHYGLVGFLKAGLQLSDRITTVSPTYAQEITQKETGMGFDGLLRVRRDRLSGILNGIDTTVWNPATDPLIAVRYDAAHIGVRAINKAALQEAFGLNRDFGALLIGVVSRLSEQKGLDLLLDVVQGIVDHGMQLALLGAGDAELEAAFEAAAGRYPGRIGVRLGYNETLAHRIQAGSDIILVPSRFEPCGLTQICGLRYGAVPLVARAGGLNDTVIDANEMALAAGAATGIQFFPITAENLWIALEKAARLHRDPAMWRTMQKNGMTADYSWHHAARQYAKLYRELLGVPASPVEYKEQARETAQPDEIASTRVAAGLEEADNAGAAVQQEPAAAPQDAEARSESVPGAEASAPVQTDEDARTGSSPAGVQAAAQDDLPDAAPAGYAPAAAMSDEKVEAVEPCAPEVPAAVHWDGGAGSEGAPADAETGAVQDHGPDTAPAGIIPAAAKSDETVEAAKPRAAEVRAAAQIDGFSSSPGAPSDVETAAMQDHAVSVKAVAGDIAGTETDDEEADSLGLDAWTLAPVPEDEDADSGQLSAVEVAVAERVNGDSTGDLHAGEDHAAARDPAVSASAPPRQVPAAGKGDGEPGFVKPAAWDAQAAGWGAADADAKGVRAGEMPAWQEPGGKMPGAGPRTADAKEVRAGEKLPGQEPGGKAPAAGPRSTDAPSANGDKALASEPRRESSRAAAGRGKAGNGAGAA
jgi:starch synthase